MLDSLLQEDQANACLNSLLQELIQIILSAHAQRFSAAVFKAIIRTRSYYLRKKTDRRQCPLGGVGGLVVVEEGLVMLDQVEEVEVTGLGEIRVSKVERKSGNF